MLKPHNVPTTPTAFLFTMLCLLLPAVTAQAQAPQSAKQERKQASVLCDVLNQGGTVYDPTQCDELSNNGMTFLRNKGGKAGGTLVMTAGKKSEWQLMSRAKKDVWAPSEVLLRRKADRSVVAKATANSRGRFTLTIPADLEGEVELVTTQHSMKQGNGTGDNEGFCFRLLPIEKNYLCEIHMEDPGPLVINLRIVQSRPRRP
jgi:hypothetical protein